MSQQKRNLLNVFSVVMLLFSLFCAGRVVLNSKKHQQIQVDKAEVSSIRYGILNADEWEKQLSVILAKKVEEFELTPENRKMLKVQLETLMYSLLDEVNEILKKDMGAVKRFLVKTFIDLDALRENVPELAGSVLDELSKPETRENLKEYILNKLESFVAEIYNLDEQVKLHEILEKYEYTDKTEAFRFLELESHKISQTILIDVLLLFSALLLVFILQAMQAKKQKHYSSLLLLAVVFIFMLTGISVPMINIEAKISSLTFNLLNEKIQFTNQVLFFQSKSILDVVWILIETWKPDMMAVGFMILLFSVLFPFTKIVSGFVVLRNPEKYEKNKFVEFFVYKSGKWSMADVFVVALFMAYIAFNGMVSSQLEQMSKVYHNVEILTTNGTSLQPGFYLFLCFCISGLVFSDIIQQKTARL